MKPLPSKPDEDIRRLLKGIPSKEIALWLTPISVLRSPIEAGPLLDLVVFAGGILLSIYTLLIPVIRA